MANLHALSKISANNFSKFTFHTNTNAKRQRGDLHYLGDRQYHSQKVLISAVYLQALQAPSSLKHGTLQHNVYVAAFWYASAWQ